MDLGLVGTRRPYGSEVRRVDGSRNRGDSARQTSLRPVRPLVSGNLFVSMPSFELFTDGACAGNPGPGGWGFILRGGGLPAEREESGGEPSTTNNRMELTAIIRGLDCLPDGASVLVTTDSEYCVKGLNEWMDGWKRRGWRKADKSPVMNRDL